MALPRTRSPVKDSNEARSKRTSVIGVGTVEQRLLPLDPSRRASGAEAERTQAEDSACRMEHCEQYHYFRYNSMSDTTFLSPPVTEIALCVVVAINLFVDGGSFRVSNSYSVASG
jgi:hypothetical protein